jgi:hypothetical protein
MHSMCFLFFCTVATQSSLLTCFLTNRANLITCVTCMLFSSTCDHGLINVVFGIIADRLDHVVYIGLCAGI